jgi:hypothetical protein
MKFHFSRHARSVVTRRSSLAMMSMHPVLVLKETLNAQPPRPNFRSPGQNMTLVESGGPCLGLSRRHASHLPRYLGTYCKKPIRPDKTHPDPSSTRHHPHPPLAPTFLSVGRLHPPPCARAAGSCVLASSPLVARRLLKGRPRLSNKPLADPVARRPLFRMSCLPFDSPFPINLPLPMSRKFGALKLLA